MPYGSKAVKGAVKVASRALGLAASAGSAVAASGGLIAGSVYASKAKKRKNAAKDFASRRIINAGFAGSALSAVTSSTVASQSTGGVLGGSDLYSFSSYNSYDNSVRTRYSNFKGKYGL